MLAACALLLGHLAVASVLDREVLFDISPGSLEAALLQLSRQAHVQIAAASSEVTEVTVNEVKGKFTTRTALTVLLRNTGLTFTTVGSTVIIERETGAPAASSAAHVCSSRRSCNPLLEPACRIFGQLNV